MAAVLSKTIGVEVLEALGLPTKMAMSLRLDFEIDSIVTATVTYAVENEAMDKVVTTLHRRRYLDETVDSPVPSNPQAI